MAQWENNKAVQLFREYLRIKSVHPDVDYEPCVAFLRGVANSIGLPMSVYRCHPKKPIVIMSWHGSHPHLPSILLNSHMDVVPVFEESWKHPPFSGHLDEEGNIYGRGAQDMKSIAIQFIEAVREMKESGIVLKRTLHLSFVPDEEIGGTLGMKLFVKSDAFRALNIGLGLDEGTPSAGDEFALYYGEKCLWNLEITCTGDPGHACSLQPNTAAEKARYIIDKFSDFRKEQCDPAKKFTDASSVNLTQIHGGVQSNVIPDKIKLGYDLRLSVGEDHEEFEKKIRDWCKEAGDDVELEFKLKEPFVKATELNDDNKFWVAYKKAGDDLGITFEHLICPGITDSRFLRELNIPAIGMSPFNYTPYLLHNHNECLSADSFLKGIQIYKNIIQSVANVA